MTKSTATSPIRIARTPAVIRALALAKKRYTTLSDAEILKLGLAQIACLTTPDITSEIAEVRSSAARAVGGDYLDDVSEDIYRPSKAKSKL
jgi:hypothetical protein